MRAADVSLAGSLVSRVAALLPVMQEHLDFYDGLLPHIFLSDVTHCAVAEFERNKESETLREVLDFLETSFRQGGDHEQEMIAVSFLENLPLPGEPGAGVLDLLGPELKKELER